MNSRNINFNFDKNNPKKARLGFFLIPWLRKTTFIKNRELLTLWESGIINASDYYEN